MYLQVLHLLDLCTGTSNQLLTGNWRKYHPIPSEYTWPKAEHPNTSDWDIWESAITTVFQAGWNLKLPHPLGNYYPHMAKGWYFEHTDRVLWQVRDQIWKRHGLIPSCSRTMAFHTQGVTSELPNGLHWATVQEHETKIILTGHGKIDQTRQTQEGLRFLQQHPFAHEWHWELVIVGNLWELEEDLYARTGYVVSNGSFQTGRGAAAWIIEGRDHTNRIIGQCSSPSNADKHSSFRSKLVGIFVTLFTLSAIIKRQTEHPKLRLACNGKLVLQRLRWTNPTDPTELHTNLLLATRYLIHNCGVKVELIHVKGLIRMINA